MARGRIVLGILLLTLLSVGFGYVFASAFLTFRDLGLRAGIDFLWLARNYLSLRQVRPDDFQLANLIIGGTAFAGMLLSAVVSGTALTKFGKTHWQRAGELKRNGFFTAPGSGFILGKMTSPRRRGRYLSSSVYPHVLLPHSNTDRPPPKPHRSSTKPAVLGTGSPFPPFADGHYLYNL